MQDVIQIRKWIKEGREDAKPWHEAARKWRKFYTPTADNGGSWDPDDRDRVESRNQKAVETNIVGPAVDLVVGLMSSVQIDFDAKPMVMGAMEMSQQSNWALKHINNINDLDMHRRNAIESSAVDGVGVILAGPYVRSDDPSEEIVQYTSVPSTWWWYDLDGKDPVLRDAKYQGISKWISFSLLIEQYGHLRARLEDLKGDPDAIDGSPDVYRTPFQTGTTVAIPSLDRWGSAEWNVADKMQEVDRHKNQVMVHEVYYKDREMTYFYVTDADDQPKRFDIRKEFDILLRPDVPRAFKQMAPVVRRCRMAGPIRLDDTILPVTEYPIAPYFWKRDDKNRPFSFIAQVEHQQQEYNARRARALWDTNSNQAQIEDSYWDEHSEEDFEELRKELGKPNGLMKAGRDVLSPWMKGSGHDQLPWISLTGGEMQMASGITSALAGSDEGKTPKSAEAYRQNTMQGGMTFEARRAGFLFAHKYLGGIALQLIIRLHTTPFVVMVSDTVSGQDALHAIRVEDIRHMVFLDVGPYTPTMLEKQIETIRLLLPMLPPDPKLQTAGVLLMLSSMNAPGVQALRAAAQDYQFRVEAGMVPPEPMKKPAYRPRQKRQQAQAG